MRRIPIEKTNRGTRPPFTRIPTTAAYACVLTAFGLPRRPASTSRRVKSGSENEEIFSRKCRVHIQVRRFRKVSHLHTFSIQPGPCTFSIGLRHSATLRPIHLLWRRTFCSKAALIRSIAPRPACVAGPKTRSLEALLLLVHFRRLTDRLAAKVAVNERA